MGQRNLHSTTVGRAVLLGVAVVCAGCWERIEYSGPDPSTVARRTPPLSPTPPSEAEMPAATDPPADAVSAPVASEADEYSADPAGYEIVDVESEDIAAELPFDDFEQVVPESAPAVEPEAESAPTMLEPDQRTPTVHDTRHAAWQLGSRLSLAALANDRGSAPENVAAWFDEAGTAAEALGTFVAALPDPAAASEDDSLDVHEYLAGQGERIWRELTDRHGADHAALFEMAVKSNVLQLLYTEGSDHIEALTATIGETGQRAGLPPELWQPLLDSVANGSPPADVRAAVRRLHVEVDRHLVTAREP